MGISAVSYLRTVSNGDINLGFILGKAKLAPVKGHTVPRLELCGAVLAVEIAKTISHHLNLPISCFRFYADSKVVLGYIYNESRRFYTYVANRVQRIRSVCSPSQWSYVTSEENPADAATRSIPVSEIYGSSWLNGPQFLLQEKVDDSKNFEMQEPESDCEVRPEIVNLKTVINQSDMLGSDRFERFSSWNSLVETLVFLRHVAVKYKKGFEDKIEQYKPKSVEAFKVTEEYVIRVVQGEVFSGELEALKASKPLPKSSNILVLNPNLDKSGLLRVGGRLRNAKLSVEEKHPVLIPGRHHIALLLVRHFHEKTYHQGRHITDSAIRSAGFWITGAKRLTSSVISSCVTCRRLRGSRGLQKMADLPEDRVEINPPFTNVGVDCFGPWTVVSRRTRGVVASSKRWAVLFSCLSTRAIHIEVIQELSSSSFINALRKRSVKTYQEQPQSKNTASHTAKGGFMAVRGPVKVFRSDQGTNFVGATNELEMNTINFEEISLKKFLYNNKTVWIFNPPHASHMGGVLERLIGVARRILDTLLLNVPGKGLTDEILTTFLAEASAIVNSRPLGDLSSDPDEPFPLSPSLILTQKPVTVTVPRVIDKKDIYTAQWKHVQLLADTFWSRWKSQYLNMLQNRKKWNYEQRNFKCGDVVVLRDKHVNRNAWPMGIVTKTFPSKDGLIRSVEVRIVSRERNCYVSLIRPVTELVLLIPEV